MVAAGGRRGRTLSLLEAMHLTRALLRLEQLPGFSVLMKHFRNPTQISSAIFEAHTAAWCADRKVTHSVELQPVIRTQGSRVVRPDFLWHTCLGSLYCECKRTATLESTAAERLERMHKQLAQCYERNSSWNESFRLDVRLVSSATNEATKQMGLLVERAHEADLRGRNAEWVYRSEHIEGAFSPRGDPVKQSPGDLVVGTASVGTETASIAERTYLSLAMPMGGRRQRVLTRLIGQARRQLACDGAKGAVFVEMSSLGGLDEKLRQLMSQAEFSGTPWISLWRNGGISSAVWRADQPFDGTLLAPAMQTEPQV